MPPVPSAPLPLHPMSSRRIEVAVAAGDGIGPEIMHAVLSVLSAAGAPITPRSVEMGLSVYARGLSAGMTEEAKSTVESLGVLLKGPFETPKGGGAKSINVTARKMWSTYANKRVFRSLPGVDTLWSRSGIDVDLTMFRENIEDTYGAVEHLQTHDVAQCRRFTTRPGCEQIHRAAFEDARRKGARRVTCGHKANIMKLTDGLFLRTFYDIAKSYPELRADDLIVDDLAAKLATDPHTFDVVVLPYLQRDILSDLCAALVGGLGYAPAANLGDQVCVFEAVHGTAPDIAGKGLANPTALLLSAVMMLRHLGLARSAARVEAAIGPALRALHRPRDLATPAPRPTTAEYAAAFIAHLPPLDSVSGLADDPDAGFVPAPRPSTQPLLHSPKLADEEIDGIDIFVEYTGSAADLADEIAALAPPGVALRMISNRGTQVWPTGSVLTTCVNHFRTRFERIDGTPSLRAPRLLHLAADIDAVARVCSTELLLRIGDVAGYSRAQGQ